MKMLRYGSERMDDGSAEITYYLTVDLFTCETGAELEGYGVMAAMEGGDTAAVRCVTVHSEEARRLLDVLRRGRVTPVTLRDVVEDWVAGRTTM